MRGTIVSLLSVVASAYGQSAGLLLPAQTAVPGQILVASLSFSSNGQAIGAIQFDIDSDASLSCGILPGVQIGTSAKVLSTAAVPNGGLRIVIAGMNQGSIQDGELLRPLIVVRSSAAPGTAFIRIDNVFAADPTGTAVMVPAVSSAVQIQAGSLTQSFVAGSVVNAASLLPGPISPGEIITVFGGPSLSGASAVLLNGAQAPILYAGTGQVNAIVPFGIDMQSTPNLEIRTPGGSLGVVALSAAPAAPGIFTANSGGTGPGAILNQDYSMNSFSNPASGNSIIMLYGTGFGALVPPPVDGQVAAGPAPTAMSVTATVGGIPADVIYAGAAPALVAGAVQVNIRVPPNLPANPATPIFLTVGSTAVPAGVTVAVQ